jgi:hypothetical protein
MVNHIFDEELDATLCGEYRGDLARAVSGHHHSCPECLGIRGDACARCGWQLAPDAVGYLYCINCDG